MLELAGRTAVITGGAGGIGFALAEAFAARGMAIVLGDVEKEALDVAVERLRAAGVEAQGVVVDVRDPEDMDRLRDTAADGAGGDLAVVCLNAGVAPTGTVLDTDPATWRWVVDVNLFGVVNGLRAFAPALVDAGHGGHVVMTASGAGLGTAPFLGAYAATKHAVVGLAAVLREELAPAKVGVTVACPASIRTSIFECERNRPDELAGDTHTDGSLLAFWQQIVDDSPPPSVVADEVLRAIGDNRLFALPSPELDPLIEERHAVVRAAIRARG